MTCSSCNSNCNQGRDCPSRIEIQSLGFLRIKWSGFHWYRAEDFEPLRDDIDTGYSYAEGAIVLGWFVYQYRVWHKTSIKND
jgi:hypothetical protein